MDHVKMENHTALMPACIVHNDASDKPKTNAVRNVSFEIEKINSIKKDDDECDDSALLSDGGGTCEESDGKNSNLIPKLICIFCRRKFVSFVKYKNHKRIHFGDARPYLCKYCGLTFENGSSRDIHETKHNVERPFECRHCKNRFKYQWYVRQHELTCQQHNFINPSGQLKQGEVQGNTELHKCKECKLEFSDYKNLQNHWKRKHSTLNPPWQDRTEKKIKVDNEKSSGFHMSQQSGTPTGSSKHKLTGRKQAARQAKKNLQNEKSKKSSVDWQSNSVDNIPMSGRIVIHYPDVQHKCELCNKRFKHLRHIHSHENMHTGVKRHKCPKCPDRFFNKGSVNYHMQVNHGAILECMSTLPKSEATCNPQDTPTSRFQCKICRKLYSNKSHLEEHERLHDPNRQFHCEVCDKGFTRLIRLWRHEVIHKGGEKKYRCNQCQARFFSKGSYDYHQKRHHMVGLSKKQTKKKKKYTARQQKQIVYECQHCSKTFGNLEVAKRHEANHFHVLRHGCTYKGCEERFALTAHMEQHVRDVHKSDRPYHCSFCPKTFKTVGHFAYHEKRHQPEKLPYICEVCEKGFTRPRAVFRHEKTHKGEKKYSCPKCPLQCHSMVSMMYHKLSKHSISYRQQGLHKIRDTWKSTCLSKNRSSESNDLQTERKRTGRKSGQGHGAEHKNQRIGSGRQKRLYEKCKKDGISLRNCEVDLILLDNSSTPVEKDSEGKLATDDEQNGVSGDNNEDTSFICELCTEEFNSERELRRHKRFHSVEIKAMQSLFNSGATDQHDHSASDITSLIKHVHTNKKVKVHGSGQGITKRGVGRPKGALGKKNKRVLKRRLGRPKGTLHQLKKSSIKQKNARSKMIRRRAAFRRGIMRLKTSSPKSKVEVSPEERVAQVLKRLSWNTGVDETNPVVENRFRMRGCVKKEEDGEKCDKKVKESDSDDVVILDEEEDDDKMDDDVVEVPVEKSSRRKKDVKNGHIMGKSPKRKKEMEDSMMKSPNVKGKSPKQQNPSKFLSLLKLTEKEREDGMAFVSRIIPVLYNGHCRSCIQCGKRFDTDEALAEHQKWHTCSKRIRCLECNMWCDNEKAYRVHWEEHALHRLLYCKHCGRDFPDKELLWRHEKTHNKDGSGNGGTSGTARQRKMEEKAYSCDMCSEAFVTAEELKVHQVSHTAPRAFVCEHCSMSFNQERQLRSHQTRHVGDLATWQKSFGCPLCGGMFRSSEELKSHERTFHGFEGKFECGFCDKTFGVEKNWRAHEEVHRSRKDTRKKKR